MDFIVGLPPTRRQNDSIWAMVDRMIKSVHYIPVKSTYSAEDYAKVYVYDIVSLHFVRLSIISNRGTQLTSRFWRSFQKVLGIRVKLSTTFHPQTDGQAERTIQTLEDMLRPSITDFKGYWDKYFPLVEFAYNSSFHSSVSMAPYQAFYDRICRSPIGLFEVGEPLLLGPDFIYETLEKVYIIRNRL